MGHFGKGHQDEHQLPAEHVYDQHIVPQKTGTVQSTMGGKISREERQDSDNQHEIV